MINYIFIINFITKILTYCTSVWELLLLPTKK